MTDPNTIPAEPATPRPSKTDALKSAATNPMVVALSIVAAVSGLVTSVKSCNESLDIARISYETLRGGIEKNTTQIEGIRKGQADLQIWVSELSKRLELRQVTTENVVATIPKPNNKPKPKPIPPEPPPKPPEVLIVPETTPLPPFDSLKN